MGKVVVLLIVIILVLWILASCIRIVPQAYAIVLERLGAYQATWGTGVHFKLPFVERVARKVNLKEQVVDFPPQPVITKDNVCDPCLCSNRTEWTFCCTLSTTDTFFFIDY